jgi:hypothetical protein
MNPQLNVILNLYYFRIIALERLLPPSPYKNPLSSIPLPVVLMGQKLSQSSTTILAIM